MDRFEWTVMIYMAGDNNLAEECIWAIKELYRVGVKDPGKIAVVVQFDPAGPQSNFKHFEITESNDTDGIFDALADNERKEAKGRTPPEDQVSASAREIREFIVKTATAKPAKHYMLILSGHGSGAIGDRLLMDEGGSKPRFLTVRGLGWALFNARKDLKTKKVKKESILLGENLDIVGLDSCLMGMLEVGYQIKNSTDYLIGAQGFEDNRGWPYHRVLGILNENPFIAPNELTAQIVQKYVKYYSDYAMGGISVDMAGCNLGRIKPLGFAVHELGKILNEKMLEENNQPKRRGHPEELFPITNAVLVAHWKTQSYKFEEYVDLWDFCHLLEQTCKDQDVQSVCQSVKQIIDNKKNLNGDLFSKDAEPYVVKCCYSGADFQHSHGVSIYFPWCEDAKALDHYNTLFITQDPDARLADLGTARGNKAIPISDEWQWVTFLKNYFNLTRRKHRKGAGIEKLAVKNPDSLFSLPVGGNKHNPPGKGMNLKIPEVKNPPLTYEDDVCIHEK